jgi:multidrug efflux pump subunit AcrA (membrane-fusion protein)
MNFAMVALSTVFTFGCIVGFESTLAGVDARTTALNLEMAAQRQTLRAGDNIERSTGAIESRIARLHLDDSLARQIATLFGDVEEIARRRGVRVTAFRHEGNARFEVAVEGEYPATLATLADLSSSRVAAQASMASFERAHGHVRATFALDVVRLGDGSARTHRP